MSAAKIRELSAEIRSLSDDPQIQQWAQSIYDASPDVVVPPAPAPSPAPKPGQIRFFEHDNYAGAMFTISEQGAANLAETGFNDRASSADVIGTWEVWTDAHYSGKRVVLEQGMYPSLRALGINDAISSARQVASQPPIAPRRKMFFPFTSKRGDLAEVTPFCTHVWDRNWGDAEDDLSQLSDATLPIVMGFGGYLFGAHGEFLGEAEAERRLRAAFDLRAGLLTKITDLYIDEPRYSREVFVAAIGTTRRVMADYLPNASLIVCYGDYGDGRRECPSIDLFDKVDFDAYGERASCIDPGGRAEWIKGNLNPRQSWLMTLGVNDEVTLLTPQEIERIANHCLHDPQCAGIDLYTWFDRVVDGGGRGARSIDGVREACIAAGMQFRAWNAAIDAAKT